MKIRPNLDYCIVQKIPDEQKSVNGLLLPVDKDDLPRAKVIATPGDFCRMEEGDTVIISRHAGETFTHEGQRYLIVNTDDILAILPRESDSQ
jgi:chaperonin GroES